MIRQLQWKIRRSAPWLWMLFDGSTKKLIWRTTATETLSTKPEKNDQKLEKNVGEMFKKFPPKSKG